MKPPLRPKWMYELLRVYETMSSYFSNILLKDVRKRLISDTEPLKKKWAAKAGVHSFSMALVQEMATKGVTVNAASSSHIGTDMVNAIRPDVVEKNVVTVPLKRLGKPSEIPSIVAWFANEVGSCATGADFSANGGRHVSWRLGRTVKAKN